MEMEGDTMKKLLMVPLLICVLFTGSVINHVSAAFSDVGDKYVEAVNHLTTNNYAQGLTETKFGTGEPIKRIDAAVMVARVMGFDENGNYPDAGFTDVPLNRQWAVNALAAAKVVSGKEIGRFGSADFMTRSEMAKVIASAYGLESTGGPILFTDVSSRFEEYVAALVENEITFGKTATQFGATQNVTRGEFALFVLRGDMLSDNTPPEVISVE